MKKGLHIGAGPIRLESGFDIEWENSDFADTESSKSWKLEKLRDFTRPFEDIADDSIDFIIGWHIIEHIQLGERDGVLREWKRILKPGGKLILACPDVSKIAKHIVDRDGPWADWFICMVNVFGPYNGYVGDFHKWGYNEAELAKVMVETNGFAQANALQQQNLAYLIGGDNANKLGFAEYNIQLEITK